MSQRASEPTMSDKTRRTEQKGRREFAAQVAASVAAMFLVRLAGPRGESKAEHNSIEMGGRYDTHQLPPPEGSVKRRG